MDLCLGLSSVQFGKFVSGLGDNIVIGLIWIVCSLVDFEKLNAQVRATVVFASDQMWPGWHTAVLGVDFTFPR